jgi:hypothetical protein
MAMHRSARLLPLLLLWPACEPDEDRLKESGATSDDSAEDSTADTDDSGDPATGRPLVAAHVASGTLTWTLDFDADAEAGGLADCAYSRVFEGVEFLDQPYRCPDCEILLSGTSTMYEGFADCYEPVFGGSPAQGETWGFDWPAGVGGPGAFYRSSSANYPMFTALSGIDALSLDEDFPLGWTSTYTLADLGLTGSGSLTLSASGSARVHLDDSILIEDLREPRGVPYACGWPLENPGPMESDHRLAQDGVLPRFHLEDACGELLDAWDLYGRYLVVDASQPDCGYCQVMAREADAALASMRAEGMDVAFVTLLGNGLSDPLSPPTDRNYEAWLTAYGREEPVLRDRGYGYAVFAPFVDTLGDSFGYPTIAVVRPDLTLLEAWSGWPSEGWTFMRDLIAADRASSRRRP